MSCLSSLETETTTCTFEIENFKDCSAIKCKEFTLSNNDKAKFRILVYPNAWHEKTFIYLILFRSDKDTKFDQARFNLSILDKNGRKCHTLDGHIREIVTEQNSWSQMTIDHNHLINPANGLLSTGKLSVYCEVYCGKKIQTSATHNLDYDYQNISNDLQSLLRDSTLSDLVLLVKEKEFKVHKCILASRSPYFAAMLTGDFKEKTQNRIEITDVDLNVFEELLFYIYTGKIPSMDKYSKDMFLIADKYQLESLKRISGQAIGSSLTVESVIKVLLLADMHSSGELKSECIEFIINNSVDVMATESWKVLTKSRPDLLVELFQALAQKANPLIKKSNICV